MRTLIATTVLCLMVITGCAGSQTNGDTDNAKSDAKEGPSSTSDTEWRDIELTDVKTGKTFRVSDFEDRPVLLESFAVWCPTCKKQQDQIKKLHREVKDEVVSISIDTDPSEDKEKVLEHIERFGYDWRFAVDQGGFAEKLVDEYGLNVVNAPSAPMVLICGDKDKLLEFGVKSADQLKDEIEEWCE